MPWRSSRAFRGAIAVLGSLVLMIIIFSSLPDTTPRAEVPYFVAALALLVVMAYGSRVLYQGVAERYRWFLVDHYMAEPRPGDLIRLR